MSSVRCAVKGCQSRRETSEGVFFHTLPASAARKRVWEKAIGCSSLPHSARVCSAHFLGSDYLPKYGNRRLVNRLRWTAVPSVDLPTNGDAAPLRQYGQRRPRGTVTTQTAFYQCTVGVQAFTLVVGRNVGYLGAKMCLHDASHLGLFCSAAYDKKCYIVVLRRSDQSKRSISSNATKLCSGLQDK
ncbi:uncharacterized protein LOC119181252 isoform X1 [Rhipicephalus microplus]|uniref:uncharacterized protein LOC119181252 isoform X1 n=1 Tax=Rhipicephalus microplus TaxID=6941 RepID=UPI003F6B9F69